MNRDQFIKDLLNLPGMTVAQARKHYCGQAENVLRELRALRENGLITWRTEYARSRDVSTRIDVRGPGEMGLSAGQIAYRAKARLSDTFSPVVVIRATAKLCTIYGGKVRKSVVGTLSHDLSLVEVLLNKRQKDPRFEWKLISMKPGTGVLPDAVSASGEVSIELVGAYNRSMVSAKLGLAAHATLELW